MAAITTNKSIPLVWHDFLSAAKRLLPQVIIPPKSRHRFVRLKENKEVHKCAKQ